MADAAKKGLTLAELAEETGCQLIGDPDYVIQGIAELESAGPLDAAYYADSRLAEVLQKTEAGVVFVDPHVDRPAGRHYLLSNCPSEAFQKLAKLIAGITCRPPGFQGIHPTAVIHESARLDAEVQIGPYAVIERDVVIGKRTEIGAGTYIGMEVVMGQDCKIYPHACILERSVIGSRVVLQSGVVIGGIGFGYQQDTEGKHQCLEHLGNVVIGDDVEIGANSTVDRARLKSTAIGRGTKIDNQVQIGHNCKIGEDNIIVSQAGLAGSVQTGKGCVLAGRACVNDHVTLADRVVIGACSAVAKSIPTAGSYIGFPAIPFKRHHRLLACFYYLDKMFTEFQKIKRQVKKLSGEEDSASNK